MGERDTISGHIQEPWYFSGGSGEERALLRSNLILFDQAERESANLRYSIAHFLPGFSVVGLRGWDDFIVEDTAGKLFTVPTVPMIREYLRPFEFVRSLRLEEDAQVKQRVKWYVQPIVFGGDPSVGPNLTWVTHEQHSELVKWWNAKYRELQ